VARQSLSFHPPLSRYRSGFPENLGEEFDAPFVRLDWLSRDRFNIQWHRHTRTWFCLHRGKSLAQAPADPRNSLWRSKTLSCEP